MTKNILMGSSKTSKIIKNDFSQKGLLKKHVQSLKMPTDIQKIETHLNLLLIKYKKRLTFAKIIIGLIGGLFVGFLSGFFGGGGGMIVVPLLMFALNLTEKQAHATAIFTILPISIASSIIYLVKNYVQFAELGYASIGFVIGGALGALLLKKLNNKVLRIIFAVIMIAAGVKIIL